MITQTTELFVQLPEESAGRVLHPGKIHDIVEQAVTFAFEEPHVAPSPGDEILVYYEIRRQFHKVPASVSMHWAEDDSSFITFEPNGEPVPTEDRAVFRVSTALSDIHADLGAERNCPVTDVSASGLSMISSQPLEIGRTSPIRIEFDGATHEGLVCVQSIKTLPTGRTRYGLSIAGTPEQCRALGKALQSISTAVQRTQLKRLAGA